MSLSTSSFLPLRYYGYTLCNVLFLTSIWHYSILQAGLALTAGPFVAVIAAGISSRVAEKLGPRAVVVAGGLVWAGAVLWMVYPWVPPPTSPVSGYRA